MDNKSAEANYDQKYPTAEYNKTIYSFTNEETAKIQSLDTIVQMGQLAEMMLNRYIKGDPLVRLGVKNTQDTGILYDLPSKKLVIYSPKIICNICHNKKGTKSYNNLIWCDECLATQQFNEAMVSNAKQEKPTTKGKK